MNINTNRLNLGRRAIRVLVLALAVALATASFGPSLDASDVVSIRVWPTTALAPTDFLVRVFVERNPSNRKIRVTAESETYFGSSEGQLDGDSSSRLRVVQFRRVPAGGYSLEAVVYDQMGAVVGTARASASVIGR